MVIKNINYYISIFLIIVTTYSCNIITEPDKLTNYGLPSYHIQIGEEEYSLFNKNVYSNLKVACTLTVNGQPYKVKIRHQGYSSRGNFKKNYEIEYQDNYIDPIINSEEVILSSQATDPSMLRAYITNEIFQATDLHTFIIKPVTLYINNNYEGLYYLIEPINKNFFLRRNIQLDELYKAINGRAQFNYNLLIGTEYGFEKKYPDDNNYYTLNKLINITSSDTEKLFNEIEKVFDVDKYLQYWAATILTCNWDGVVHNFYLLKTNGRYEIVPWDLDRTLTDENNLTEFPGGNYLIKKLLENKKYKTKYVDYFRQIIKNKFNENYLFTEIDSIKSAISNAYYNDRWIKTNNYNLDYEVERIKDFISKRIIYITNHLNNN